jgi:aryl-alcohol dehydrogenase-like predicted oxidoreductase
MKTKPRDAVIVATKITGPGHGWFVPPVRHGMTMLDRHAIIRAVEDSLTRLQTDYIDLYQTHWPDHGMRYEEIMETLTELVQVGKVRAFGCSNETSWGLMKSLWASDVQGLGRYETVQNNFSLLNRRCENELAQVCRQEQVSLLPYSPLAGGVLTGKYLDDHYPEGARFAAYLKEGNERQKSMAYRFINPRSLEATARFKAIAEDIGMSLTTMATAWSKQHDFVGSTIIGASQLDHLDDSLKAADIILDEETLTRIAQVEVDLPNSFGEDGLRRL